jgi:hypothetical protein
VPDGTSLTANPRGTLFGTEYVAAKSPRVIGPSERPSASPRPTRISLLSRDLVADWTRWSLGERIIAMSMVVLAVFAIAVAAAILGRH